MSIEDYYVANYDKLVKKFSRRCGSVYDAEDVVQSSFERALRYASSCKGSMDKWFSGILNNCFKDYQRTSRLGALSRPIEEHLDDIEPVPPEGLPLQVVKEIKGLIKKEPVASRRVLRMHFCSGMTIGEILSNEKMPYKQINNIINSFRIKVLKRYT